MSTFIQRLTRKAMPWLTVPLIAATYPAHAVVIYREVGDAGELPATAQSTTDTTQAFDEIQGTLSPTRGDSVDMFRIFISGGGDFSAQTVGGVAFDSELFLFDSNGRGVYANDDTNGFLTPSVLPAHNALTPTAAGFYYLAISQCCHQPFSSGGAIFQDVDGGAGHLLLSGPTGPGGAFEVTSFGGGFDQNPGGGPYTIFLTGAFVAPVVPGTTGVPEPETLSLLLAGLLSVGFQTLIRDKKRAARCALAVE